MVMATGQSLRGIQFVIVIGISQLLLKSIMVCSCLNCVLMILFSEGHNNRKTAVSYRRTSGTDHLLKEVQFSLVTRMQVKTICIQSV